MRYPGRQFQKHFVYLSRNFNNDKQMEFVKTRGLAGALLLFLFMISFTGCNDDNGLTPITLIDREETTITMWYGGDKRTEFSFPLQGGDGNYSVKSGNNKVVTAKMISPIDLSLKAIGLGEAIVMVTDNSQNELALNVRVDYETHTFVVVHHDVSVTGGDLTGNEIKTIRELQLAQIPVKAGGGYKFTFTDAPNSKGVAVIYPEAFGSSGIEATFECKKFKSIHELETASYDGYEVIMGNEKRAFVLGKYVPSGESTRAEAYVPRALMEDVTRKVQTEYPKAELVYTSQVIEGKVY